MADENHVETDTITVAETQGKDMTITDTVGIADAQVVTLDGTSTPNQLVADFIRVAEEVSVYTGTFTYVYPFTAEIVNTHTMADIELIYGPDSTQLQ